MKRKPIPWEALTRPGRKRTCDRCFRERPQVRTVTVPLFHAATFVAYEPETVCAGCSDDLAAGCLPAHVAFALGRGELPEALARYARAHLVLCPMCLALTRAADPHRPLALPAPGAA